MNCSVHQQTKNKRQRPRDRQSHGPHTFEHTHTHTALNAHAHTIRHTPTHTHLKTHTRTLERTQTPLKPGLSAETPTSVCIVPPFMSEAFTFWGPVKIQSQGSGLYPDRSKSKEPGSRLFPYPKKRFWTCSDLTESPNKVLDFFRTVQNPKTMFRTDFRASQKRNTRFRTDFRTGQNAT